MRFKADTGESNTGLLKGVKLNRGRPMAMAIRGRVLARFDPQWPNLKSAVACFGIPPLSATCRA
jgi:hypothetical protein